VGKAFEEDAKNAHSIYRQSLKIKDYQLAFEYWEQAYALAPAADGKRDYHFWDGIKLYQEKLKSEKDTAKKKEYTDKILSLYDAMVDCYKHKGISLKGCSTDSCYKVKMGYVLGRKAYDMFYTYKSPYSEVYKVTKESINSACKGSEYIILTPFGYTLADLYKKGKVDKEEARDIIDKAQRIAEYNIEHDKQYGQYWKQALARMDKDLMNVQKEVFDCAFFKKKLRPMYDENKDVSKTVKYVLVTLKRQGCPEDDPMVQEVDATWKIYAEEFNKKLQDSLEKANPALAGNRLKNEGKYKEAAQKYTEAIEQEVEPSKKAQFYFALANLQFAHLNKYSAARANARKAASLKPGWGKPYLLIGDMYSKSAKSCGEPWNQRLVILAALDKYYYAKSIDSSVTDKANKRISNFSGSKPTQEDGFMRGYKAGQVVSTGCWVGEKVKLRFSKK
jgi:tetratricopeptide (TPR) repeat protein